MKTNKIEMPTYHRLAACLALAVILTACGADRTASPTATSEILETQPPVATTAVLVPTRAPIQPTPTDRPTAPPEPTLTPTPVPPTATPTRRPHLIIPEPTFTPRPDDADVDIIGLPLGQRGEYVNLTYGYWLHYPLDWFTGFGNRPLLASFSDLNPETHDLQTMRNEGCLIEVRTLPNIYGFTFDSMVSQLPQAFPDVQQVELDGEPAHRVRRSGEGAFDSEWVYVQHADRFFTLRLDYAEGKERTCRQAWEEMLDRWRWFTPEFAAYLNPTFGYSISHPRPWYRFNAHSAGISVSSRDPSGVTDWPEFLERAMVVETNVFDNEPGLSLREWLSRYGLDAEAAVDIPLEDLRGMSVLTSGPEPEIESTNGYYLGPLDRVYEISCLYPEDRKWVYRPVANAIIYSFYFY